MVDALQVLLRVAVGNDVSYVGPVASHDVLRCTGVLHELVQVVEVVVVSSNTDATLDVIQLHQTLTSVAVLHVLIVLHLTLGLLIVLLGLD